MFGIKSLFRGKDSSSNAKNRLEMVLVQDRSGLSNKQMKTFKKELLEVMQKYFILEKKGLDIEWQREGNSTALVINSNLRSKGGKQVKAAA